MAAPAQAALTLTPIDSDEPFTASMYATSPPGDTSRVFVIERAGEIELVLNGEKQDTPFLTIPDVDSDSPEIEGGLLGLVFPPDYGTSGLFYVYLTPDDADPLATPMAPIEIREYQRSTTDPNMADPATEREVLTIEHDDFGNHYGGTLRFGPDGLLYASTGDGGGNLGANARNTSSRLGKLLRFDPRGDDPGDLSIPASNPFVGVAGDDLVWSYGLRNPFRFSFDRLTGDLLIGDVGENTTEEVDFAAASAGGGRGADFGWDACEGPFVTGSASAPCPLSGDVPPVHSYGHSGSGCSGSITGGVVVRDPALPTLAGRYLYGDFCQDFMRSVCVPSGTADAPSDLPLNGPAAFGEDASGRVLVVQLSGQVSRLSGSLDLEACPAPSAGGGGVPNPPRVPPGTPAAPALGLKLGGAARQRPLRSGNVGVRLRCDAACSARSIGTLSLRAKGRRIRLRQAAGRRANAGSLALRLRLTKGGRAHLRRALRARKRVRASITVRVRDSAGALTVRRRTVRLVR